MGCDIHGYIEFEAGSFWGWTPVVRIDPIVDRNYTAFARLFGVRNSRGVIPIAPQRGIPQNAAREVRETFERGGVDYHSASWIGVDEIPTAEHAQEFYTEDWNVLFDLMRSLTKLPRRSYAERNLPVSVRLVVWFDN